MPRLSDQGGGGDTFERRLRTLIGGEGLRRDTKYYKAQGDMT